MTPHNPYLLRAFYDWIVDNELTPHIVVDATQVSVVVPQEYVSDGQIVLNVAPHAVGNLQLNLNEVMFNARFNGRAQEVYVPISSVMAIYARENGAGTMFELDGYDNAESPSELIAEEVVEDPADDLPAQPPKGRPSLRVVK